MFSLEGEPSCFAKHYGLTAIEEEISTDKKIQSPDIHGRIQIDMPKCVSPLETILEENEEQEDTTDRMSQFTY